MIKLSIEDKAKRYDEAIINGSRLWECGLIERETYEDIFPELKESEDERIRGAIIDHLKDNNLTEWASWLEKHGEQKSEVVDNLHNYLYGEQKPFDYEHANIQQKDFASIEQKSVDSYCQENCKGYQQTGKCFADGDCKAKIDAERKTANKTLYPETLEKAIDLYYYSYGNGEGEFEHLSLEKFKDIVHTFVSDYSQKPTEWSEEDDEHLERILKELERQRQRPINSPYLDKIESDYNWLKSLKERVLPQPKQEWSDWDKTIIESIEALCDEKIESVVYQDVKEHVNDIKEWLKSLRPQNWTKEDKERYISCLQRLGTGNPEQPETINSKWFKEHVYPQSTWKPSDEQMQALNDLNLTGNISYAGQGQVLINLYNDLKKLRKE